jgi:beta-galactosidase
LQTLGFPRELQPEVAISYSWESRQAADRVKPYYSTPYLDHKHHAYEPFYRDNIDVAVIHLAHENLTRYKLVVIPGEYLLTAASADAVRQYVAAGGTVVMTAASAKTDENNQWFNTPLPGKLSDVFGLKSREFYHHSAPLTGTVHGVAFEAALPFYEVLEPTTAEVVARFANLVDSPPVVTSNRYGQGRAIYVATVAQPSVLAPLYRHLVQQLGIQRGPATPEGVQARVVQGRTLYVNTHRQPVEIALDGAKKGILSGKTWSDRLHLAANGVELLE